MTEFRAGPDAAISEVLAEPVPEWFFELAQVRFRDFASLAILAERNRDEAGE